MATQDWKPDLYLRYAAYRARPADDLLPRLNLSVPGDIYDLGCGPGTLTKRIKDKWPDRRVVGLDASPAMLAEAQKSFGDHDIRWVQGDIGSWRAPTAAALVFANASLHWVPDHIALIPRLLSFVVPGGVLAFQVPYSARAQYGKCIAEVIAAPKWRDKLKHVTPHDEPLDEGVYYDLLCGEAGSIDIWRSDYSHVLEGDNPAADWVRSTGLVPFLSALPKEDHSAFIADYATLAGLAYPRQKDGKVLFTMMRLFVIATRRV